MDIEQRRFFTRTRFTLDTDRLTFSLEHDAGYRSFDVHYADIPMETTDLESRVPWFRNAAMAIMIAWVCRTAVGLADPVSASGLALHWPLSALCCLLVYHFVVTRFTVFKTEAGKLYLICDGRHDELMTELLERRKSQLLSWYGEIDYANDPGEEIQKFHWLKTQGVIGDDEFETIRTRIEVFHGPMQEPDFMDLPSIN